MIEFLPVKYLHLPVFLLLTLSACSRGGGEASRSSPSAPEAAPSDGLVRLTAEQVQSLGIRTAPAEKAQSADFVVVQGRVVPRSGHRASVIAPFPGRLVAAPGDFPTVGRPVKQGQSLGWVEQLLSATESLQVSERRIVVAAEMERARQEMEQRARDLERARKLYEGGVIPLKQLQQAELDYNLAQTRHQEAAKSKAAYDRLEKDAASPRRVELRAPIAGTVLEVNASPGQQVEPARPIFEIADLGTVWVEARVFEEYLARVRAAPRVEIVAPSDPQTPYTGRLVSSTRQVDAASRTEGVLYAVENRDGHLALGAFVEVRLPGSGAPESGTRAPAAACQIPAAAVFREQDSTAVFIEKAPGVYQRRVIETGPARGDRIAVLKGLEPGQAVVVAGAAALRSHAELGPKAE